MNYPENKGRALEGVRVLDFTTGWSGPIGARFLADLGAEVIKIESLYGRGAREVPTPENPKDYAKVAHAVYPYNDPGDQPYNRYGIFNEYHRNKMSLTLDLSRDDCRELARRLVPISDVIMENYSARVMRNFGLDYPSVRPLNPAIVFISMPGYGMTGPHRNHVSYGTNIEPSAGLSNLIGYPGGDPYKSGEAYPDPNAGVNAVGAILTALFYRRRSGKGQFIDLSQNEATASLIGESVLGYQLTGEHPARMGNHHAYYAPHNAYKCKGEDNWVTIAVTNDQEWEALCEVAGNPDWACELRFQDQLSRWQYQDEIDEHISKWTAGEDYKDLMHRLQGAGVTAAAVYTNQDVVEDGHLKERGYFWDIPHAAAGTMPFSGIPALLSKTPGTLMMAAPLMGEHNRYVLEELAGIESSYADQLEAEGAIGTRPPEGIPGIFA